MSLYCKTVAEYLQKLVVVAEEKLPDSIFFLFITFQEKSQADTLHFWDGERKIDIVLAFEDDENGPEDIRKAEKRKTFQRNLEEQGLELELEPSHVNRSSKQ